MRPGLSYPCLSPCLSRSRSDVSGLPPAALRTLLEDVAEKVEKLEALNQWMPRAEGDDLVQTPESLSPKRVRSTRSGRSFAAGKTMTGLTGGSAFSGGVTSTQVRRRRLMELNWGRTKAWKAKVEELAVRGVTLQSIVDFYLELFDAMPHFDPRRSTTRDVVRWAIIPRTREGLPGLPKNCALAVCLNGGEARTPDKMVTHHWGNKFAHTVAAILADAFGRPLYGGIAEQLGSPEGARLLAASLADRQVANLAYWFCPFSVNQHVSICEGFAPGGPPEHDTVLDEVYPLCDCGTEKHWEGDLCEMNKFSEMMAKLREANPEFGHVIAVDEKFEIFDRAWCIGEIVQGKRDGLIQVLKIPSVDVVRGNREKLESLDVRNCNASRESDRVAILAEIPNIPAFNEEIKRLLLEPEKGLLADWSASVLMAAAALGAQGTRYLLERSAFSGEYRSRISDLSIQRRSWCEVIAPLLAIVVMPAAFALLIFTLPFQRPDAGLYSNYLHFTVMVPIVSLICYICVPQWTEVATKVKLPGRCTILWPLVAAFLTAAPVPLTAVLWGVYPVPFAPLLAGAAYLLCLPLLWVLIPRAARSQAVWRRFAWSLVAQICLALLLCVCYPALNAWLSRASRWTEDDQAIGYFVFFALVVLAVRVFFERLCRLLSKRMHADVLPATVFVAELAYQAAVCCFFTKIRHWALFGTIMSVALLENAYYLHCFHRHQPSTRRRPSGLTSASSSSLRSESERKAFSESVVAVLLLREFADLLVPVQFCTIFAALYFAPSAPYNLWVSGMSREDLERTFIYLASDIAMGLMVVGLSTGFLYRGGVHPLRFLYGVIKGSGYLYYLAAATTIVMWYASLQLVHSGCDYSLRFEWALGDHKGPHPTWVAGFHFK